MRIRSYVPRDRDALRHLCCDTADQGGPVERFFRDREVFADLVTRYYTDYEPQSAWVAEHQGQLVGYLTGCLDTHRYRRIMARGVIPLMVCKALRRGVLGSREIWRLARARLQNCQRGGWRHEVPLDRYPAHLHVNVQQGFRSQQVGRQLVEQFLVHVRAAGLPGVHAAVVEDNRAACHFFERLGFLALSRHPIVRPDGASGRPTATVIYGKVV